MSRNLPLGCLGSPCWQQSLVGKVLRRSAIGVRVIGQYANDFAFTDNTRPAFADHPLKLTFESGEAGNTGIHLSQLFLSDGISGGTGLLGVVGQTQKLFDRLKRKAEFSRMPNEGQAFDVRWLVNSLVSGSPGRGRN